MITSLPLRSFSSSPIPAATTKKPRQRQRDPYAERQARARRLAHLSRQDTLKKQRADALGDPIRGIETPFVKSFDTALPPVIEPTRASVSAETSSSDSKQPPPSPAQAINEEYVNYYLNNAELRESLELSSKLSEPMISESRDTADPQREADEIARHKQQDAIAREAVSRIVSLANASSKERLRTNVQRCVNAFGRHKTDQELRPRPPSAAQLNSAMEHMEPTPRAGPDTGSSEVQIAILTAKIRVLADRYEGVNRNDKVNKRNLRLLLHKRQKLLKYLQRRERGGERWQNLIGTLGLTEGTWRGQIAVE